MTPCDPKRVVYSLMGEGINLQYKMWLPRFFKNYISVYQSVILSGGLLVTCGFKPVILAPYISDCQNKMLNCSAMFLKNLKFLKQLGQKKSYKKNLVKKT